MLVVGTHESMHGRGIHVCAWSGHARRAGGWMLFFAALAVAWGQTSTYQRGSFRIDVPALGPFNYPMDGVKLRIVVTNTSSASISTGTFQAQLKETNESLMVLPQPRSLAAGQSISLSCVIDSGFLSLPSGVPTTRTLVWNFGGSDILETPFTVINWGRSQGGVVTPSGNQGINVSVRVTDEKGSPLTGVAVFARARSNTMSLMPAGTDGTYAAILPPSSNWVISAEATGRRTGFLFLDDPSKYTGHTIALPTQSVSFTYQPAVPLESGVGPWLGRLSAAQDAILLTSGMEHWGPAITPLITESKLRLYSTDGTKRWEFRPGYEAWGADLSADGKWAAVATLDPANSSSGAAGPPSTLTLIDAATGKSVWQQTLDAAFMRSPPAIGPGGSPPGIREVKFSPDGSKLAIGDNRGDLVLIRRSDPALLVMAANLGGDVRAIQFSADSAKVYVAFGSGLTAAFRLSDGAELWRVETYSWVHPEGFVLSSDGGRLGVMAQGGDVLMIDTASGRVLWQRDTKSLAWWAAFSGDGTVFVAGTQTGGTLGFSADFGTPLFAVDGGKGGAFAGKTGYFLLGNRALYDQTGTRISNLLTGFDQTRFGNWQFVWVSADGLRLMLAEQESDSATMPILYSVTGTKAGDTSPPANSGSTITSALSNLSVRTTMAAEQTLILGSVITGGTKTILVRAGGPALNQFGLQGMVDPRLELYTTGPAPIVTNEDWSSALASTFASVGAFAFAPGSKDAALSQPLTGSFTVQARGTGPGVVLVELYDVTGGTGARLINGSARNIVGTGENILIAGFNISGSGSKTLLIRGIGPGLAQYGVTGFLVDPKVQVFDSNNVLVASNDNWDPALAATFTAVGAFALSPNSKDAALLVTLNAGTSYTAQVSGSDGGTGDGIVEIYEVP